MNFHQKHWHHYIYLQVISVHIPPLSVKKFKGSPCPFMLLLRKFELQIAQKSNIDQHKVHSDSPKFFNPIFILAPLQKLRKDLHIFFRQDFLAENLEVGEWGKTDDVV